MASKHDMMNEMLETFKDRKRAFKEIDVPEKIFFRWIELLNNYDKMRSGYNFIFKKFFKTLITIDSVLENHPDHAWAALKIASRNERLVVILRGIVNDAKKLWMTRPHKRKRGGSQ